MPIDPVALGAQTETLKTYLDDPATLALKVRGLLDDYAQRTHRPSPRLAGNAPASSLKIPAPVMRAISQTLREGTRTSPSVLLNVARAIWAGGSREERRIAAELLGQAALVTPEKTLLVIEACLPEIESADTADALAEYGLSPLVKMNPATYLAQAQGWAKSNHKWTRRFALAILHPLLKDKKWDSVPSALEVVSPVMTDPESDVRSAAVTALCGLAPKSPVEVGRFLRQQANNPHHNVQNIIRLTLAKLAPEVRAEVERVMRV